MGSAACAGEKGEMEQDQAEQQCRIPNSLRQCIQTLFFLSQLHLEIQQEVMLTIAMTFPSFHPTQYYGQDPSEILLFLGHVSEFAWRVNCMSIWKSVTPLHGVRGSFT